MRKVIKYFLATICFLFLIAIVLIFRPVPIVFENKAITEKGVVSEIFSNEGNDVIFLLKNKQQKFYINRGLESGLGLSNLKEKLIGNLIVVKYPKYWTPLDWNNSVRHISKIEFNEEVIFNELKE